MPANQPYPLLRFVDGRQCVMECDASLWPTLAMGHTVTLQDEGTALRLGTFVVDAISHAIVVRSNPAGAAVPYAALGLLRVTTVDLLRVEAE